SKDGTTVSLGVIAYDYAGNAAPDGTAINFVAESGFIEPASCTTVGGTCSVNWQSGGLRPGVSTLSSDLLRSNEVEAVGGAQVLGMTTIMAYALGEAGFTDLNNNGLYDSGEPKIALAEVFLDNNFDGVFDSIPVTGVQDHIFIDIDGDSQYSG